MPRPRGAGCGKATRSPSVPAQDHSEDLRQPRRDAHSHRVDGPKEREDVSSLDPFKSAVRNAKSATTFVQGRRGWVRLHEKGGKEHEVPCHHNLERYLDEYIAAAGIAEDPDAPLFQTAAGRTGRLTGNALWQQDAYRMIQRRAKAAGIQTRIGNHTFRTTQIPSPARPDRQRLP